MSVKVSKETLRALEGVRNEAGANRSLNPSNDYSRGFNDGITEAIAFVRTYERGDGLFQITATDQEPDKEGG